MRRIFSITLGLLLLTALATASSAWSDPAQDERATVRGQTLPGEAGCRDGRVDFTGISLETLEETVQVAISFRDLSDAPGCDVAGLETLRSEAPIFTIYFHGEDAALSIIKSSAGAYMTGHVGDISFRGDPTLTTEGSTLVFATPTVFSDAWDGSNDQEVTLDLRGQRFDYGNAFAQSRGYSGPPGTPVWIEFDDRFLFGAVTI